MEKITFLEEKLTSVTARKLIKEELDKILDYLEDNPVPFYETMEADFDSFSIYNDLSYKGQNYDIYGKFSFKKDYYEECRIFLTLSVDRQGVTVYKDTIEESDISALVEYLLEVEELVYLTEKENRRKEKKIAA